MQFVDSAISFIPNVLKKSMYFGHQLGDTVLPRILNKVGLPPVASELAALPVTAVGAGAALWVGASNVITPLAGIAVSIFNPMGLLVFVPMAVVFGAVTCVGIGMGDAVMKKFGKTPIFDGIYDNQKYRSERKVRLNEKAAKEKAAAELAAQQQLNADQPQATAQANATPVTPGEVKPFAGHADSSQPQSSVAGVRSASPTFNNNAEVPKFAGFPPAAEPEQGPRERPPHPGKPS